ncbi:hypothetical protein Btru_064629 [Bulinus truncatus]|nr:hypothetical protein Btru_064629 [Bulinus truncatus]
MTSATMIVHPTFAHAVPASSQPDQTIQQYFVNNISVSLGNSQREKTKIESFLVARIDGSTLNMAYYIISQCLTASMVASFICGAIFFTLGLLLTFCQDIIVEDILDPVVKKVNLTKLLVNSYESLVPTKDDLPTVVYMGAWTSVLSYGVLVLGAAMLVFSIYGSLAARYLAPSPLFILLTMLLVTLAGQYLLTINVMFLSSDLHSRAKQELIETLIQSYEVGAKTQNTFTFILNSVMLMAECCGINGEGDFYSMNLTFVYSVQETNSTVYVPMKFPPACCNASFVQQGFKETLACASSKNVENINEQGCYDTLFDKTVGSFRHQIFALISVVMGWEIMQSALAFFLLIRPKPEEIEARKQALEAKNFSKEGGKTKDDSLTKLDYLVFVPHASISSVRPVYGPPDTEIW